MSTEHELLDKSINKTIRQKKIFVSKEKNKIRAYSKNNNNNNKNSADSNKKDSSIIYSNKNIIINDITNNYNNIQTAFNNKRNKKKLKKLNIGDISTDIINFKSHRKISKDLMNNTFSNFKLNKSNYISRKNKRIFKSSLDDKLIKPIEKKKVTNVLIKNINQKNNCGFGDSYEFNFTFNNFNNTITQTNYMDELKNTKGKRKKMEFENLSNKTINDFTSVKNNIINNIKEIIINNKNKGEPKIEKTKQNLKNRKIGVIRKNKKKNKDKNLYAIKIQKVFRGYILRKNKSFKNSKNPAEKVNCNPGIYIKKKILNKKSGLNLNINDKITNYEKEYNITEVNLTQGRLTENKINKAKHGNKIEEIIIDKYKLSNVLGRTTKRKDSCEIKFYSAYKFGIDK